MFETVANVIKGAAMLAAAAPGVAMLVNVVPVPPTIENLITASSLAVGAAIVISIMILRRSIQNASAPLLAIGVVIFALGGAWAAMKYVEFATVYVVSFVNTEHVEERVVVPVTPSPELAAILGDFNGDYAEALVSGIRGPRVRQLVNEGHGPTYTRLVCYLLLAQILLLTAIVGGAWKVAEMFRKV